MKAVISSMYLSFDIANPHKVLNEFMKDVCNELGLRALKIRRKYSRNDRAVLTYYVKGWKEEYLSVLLERARERFSGKVRVFVRVLR